MQLPYFSTDINKFNAKLAKFTLLNRFYITKTTCIYIGSMNKKTVKKPILFMTFISSIKFERYLVSLKNKKRKITLDIQKCRLLIELGCLVRQEIFPFARMSLDIFYN